MSKQASKRKRGVGVEVWMDALDGISVRAGLWIWLVVGRNVRLMLREGLLFCTARVYRY